MKAFLTYYALIGVVALIVFLLMASAPQVYVRDPGIGKPATPLPTLVE